MPVKIFFCYAREDELLLNKLKAYLKPLKRQGLIDFWFFRAFDTPMKIGGNSFSWALVRLRRMNYCWRTLLLSVVFYENKRQIGVRQ